MDVCAKPMYKCAVCGEVYDSISNRMNCEQKCLKKQEEEARKAAEAKKRAEYDARINEVNTAFEKAYKLRDKFVADYGEYYYNYHNVDEAIRSADEAIRYVFGL